MNDTSSENKGKIEMISKSVDALLGSFNDFKKVFYESMAAQSRDFLNEIRIQRSQFDSRIEKIEKKLENVDTKVDVVTNQYGKDKAVGIALATAISTAIGLIFQFFLG